MLCRYANNPPPLHPSLHPSLYPSLSRPCLVFVFKGLIEDCALLTENLKTSEIQVRAHNSFNNWFMWSVTFHIARLQPTRTHLTHTCVAHPLLNLHIWTFNSSQSVAIRNHWNLLYSDVARLTVDVEDRDGRIEEHKKTIVDKLAEISETCSERDDTYVQWVFYFNRNRQRVKTSIITSKE